MALGENDNTDPYLNLDPSEDIQLNVFLLEISKDITDEDLHSMKFLLQGGSKKAVLAEIKTPLDLFTHMRQRQLLTRNNLVVLQSFIWNLGNKKIFNKLIDFANTIGDALHFTVPRETPENGYMYLHYHIKGNLNTFTRPKLEAIRNQTCRLLMVPQQFVVVAGLQPSDSLILTLMIPEDCFPTKLEIKVEDEKLLTYLGVDRITSQGGDMIFEDCAMKCQSSTENISNTDLEIKRLLKKQEDLENELEKAHITILQQHRELSEWHPVEDPASKFEGFLFFLATILYIKLDLHKTKKSPRWEESLLCFKRMLKKVREKGYDEDVIQQLLEAHAMVLREDHNKKVMIQEFLVLSNENIINAQAQQISRLEYECTKLRYYYGCGDKDLILSEREEYFLQSLYDPLIKTLSVLNQLPDNEVMKIFDRLSNELNEEEWKQIYESETFSTKEECILQKDRSKLLQILAKRPDVVSPIEAFLGMTLRKIKRRGYFLAKFQYFAESLKLQQKAQRNGSSAEKRNWRGKKKQAMKKGNQENKITEILDRLARIEGKMDQKSNPLRSMKFEENNGIINFMEKYCGRGLEIT